MIRKTPGIEVGRRTEAADAAIALCLWDQQHVAWRTGLDVSRVLRIGATATVHTFVALACRACVSYSGPPLFAPPPTFQ